MGWLNRDSRAKPAVAFEGDTPKEFTDLLRLADPLKEKRLTISLEDRRHYMRTWGKHMAPDIRKSSGMRKFFTRSQRKPGADLLRSEAISSSRKISHKYNVYRQEM